MTDLISGIRIIVCGGRDFNNRDAVFAVLDKLDSKKHIAMVVHGNAAGADSWGKHWAAIRNRRDWAFPAEWSKYGISAGPRRNKQMLGSGAEIVVAFPGGKGTRNMVNQARSAGLEVLEITPTNPSLVSSNDKTEI